MTVGSNTLHFAYEASGRPLAVIYNGTRYHYVTNLQGDVVQIRQGTTPVVNYTYDAWGKLLTISGDLASTLGTHNPLRYRGYVYDTETGLYYLQSRYYNPTLGRFLNADAFASTGQGFVGNNMFAYCNNNPVAFEDISGTASKSCLYDSTEPRLPWRDSGSGGGSPHKDYSSGSNYYGEVSDKFYTVKFMNAAGNGIKKGTKYLWSVCVNGYNTQQNAQRQEVSFLPLYRYLFRLRRCFQ
jgi:RHS repeat-associated protein